MTGNNKEALSSGDRQTELDKLLKEVGEKCASPHDSLEVAAVLESFGWIDKRATEVFGVSDVFELATMIWNMVKNKVSTTSIAKPEKFNYFAESINLIKSFLRGVIFALPMFLSLAAMLTLRLSLWSYQLLSTELATCIGIGTILSFVTVGGFMQTIARTSFFNINQGFYGIAKKTTYAFIEQGIVVSIAVSVIYYLINLYFRLFPANMVIVTLAYYFFLCTIWLSLTVMYVLKKEIIFSGLILIGIGIVALLFLVLGVKIITSQLIALGVVSVLGFIIVTYYFNKLQKKMEKGIAVGMPRRSVTAFILAPYFLYGAFYFAFLFLDRVLAWSANGENTPWIVWFRGDYELGLDFSLLMMILPMGFCEVVVTWFMRKLEYQQKSQFINYQQGGFNKSYTKQYLGSLLLVAVTSVVSAFLVFSAVEYLNAHLTGILEDAYSFNDITYFVFRWGLAAYGILSVGVTNAVILFSLSRPKPVMQMMGISIVVNFLIGFVLTRWFTLEYAVLGIFVGAIVFLAGTLYYALQAIQDLDYCMYAAS